MNKIQRVGKSGHALQSRRLPSPDEKHQIGQGQNQAKPYRFHREVGCREIEDGRTQNHANWRKHQSAAGKKLAKEESCPQRPPGRVEQIVVPYNKVAECDKSCGTNDTLEGGRTFEAKRRSPCRCIKLYFDIKAP